MTKIKNTEELLLRLEALFGQQAAKKIVSLLQSLESVSDEDFDLRLAAVLRLMEETLPQIGQKYAELSVSAKSKVEKLQILVFMLKSLKGEGQYL